MESSLEGNGGDLMDQCSWHDTPPAFSVNLTNWLGHDLDIGLSALESRVLTSQWLGGKNAPFEANLPVPLESRRRVLAVAHSRGRTSPIDGPTTAGRGEHGETPRPGPPVVAPLARPSQRSLFTTSSVAGDTFEADQLARSCSDAADGDPGSAE